MTRTCSILTIRIDTANMEKKKKYVNAFVTTNVKDKIQSDK